MKILTLIFTLFTFALSAQETPKICTKTIVIKPLFIESEELIDVPEVVEWKCVKTPQKQNIRQFLNSLF